MSSLSLNAQKIYGFTNAFLLKSFDNPVPTPSFHLEMWDYVANSEDKYVAIAAPRGHSKSTVITHAYVLAMVLFRIRDYVVVVSDTETQAIQFLGDIKKELLENESIRKVFGITNMVKDTESDIIVNTVDLHKFRITAKGSEQKVRGLKWANKRPNLIVCDDLENDEIVLNEERRNKFKKWFLEALLPSGSDNCLYRIVGTILHLDSLLESFMPQLSDPLTVVEPLKIYSNNPERMWKAIKFRAHTSVGDFTDILWPERFPERVLRRIQRLFEEQGNMEGYSAEYLNDPLDQENIFFSKEDLINITDVDEPLSYYASGDLAISIKDRRAFTVFAIAGMNSQGILKIVDIRRFRSNNAFEIIDTMLHIQKKYRPELFVLEQENIARSIGAVLDREQIERKTYINLYPLIVTQDKAKRARSFQARLRAGGIEIDKEAPWYREFEAELLQFPKGKYMDQVDAMSNLCLALDQMIEAPTIEEIKEEEFNYIYDTTFLRDGAANGRNHVTGY